MGLSFFKNLVLVVLLFTLLISLIEIIAFKQFAISLALLTGFIALVVIGYGQERYGKLFGKEYDLTDPQVLKIATTPIVIKTPKSSFIIFLEIVMITLIVCIFFLLV